MAKEMMRAKMLREATVMIGEMSFMRTNKRQMAVEMRWKKSLLKEASAKKLPGHGSLQMKSTMEIYDEE